jgi:hypothetical protein
MDHWTASMLDAESCLLLSHRRPPFCIELHYIIHLYFTPIKQQGQGRDTTFSLGLNPPPSSVNRKILFTTATSMVYSIWTVLYVLTCVHTGRFSTHCCLSSDSVNPVSRHVSLSHTSLLFPIPPPSPRESGLLLTVAQSNRWQLHSPHLLFTCLVSGITKPPSTSTKYSTLSTTWLGFWSLRSR